MTSQASQSSITEATAPAPTPPSLEFTTPEDLLELATQLNEQVKQLKALSANVNKALKNCSKLSKNGAFAKKQKKKVVDPNAPPRTPSGFAKPVRVSGELETFLGLTNGEEIARTEVTKRLTNYIKENNLQNPADKRELIMDDGLNKLLKPNEGETVTFFTLQRYLKHHYITTQGSSV